MWFVHGYIFILGAAYLASFSCEEALLGSVGSVSEDLRSCVVLLPCGGIGKPTLVISLTFLFGALPDLLVLRKRSFIVGFRPQACC